MTPIRRAAKLSMLLTLCIALGASGCTRRAQSSAIVDNVAVSLSARNNLAIPLELRVEIDNKVAWRGAVAASNTVEASIGQFPANTAMTLIATDQQGTVVSVRRGILARRDVLQWVLP